MNKFLAKDFNTRQEFEQKISSMMGLTADEKPDYLISGTRIELKKLYLSQGKIFWGIKCEETNFVEPPKVEKINRGKFVKPKLENINIKDSIEL